MEKKALEIWADEIATPQSQGGFLRLRPGRIVVSKSGNILEVDSLSRAKLRVSSKSRKIFREKVLIPGLIDCHTHLVFGGNRADEWGARLKGATYQAIAASGGGIQKTVNQTRMLSKSELKVLARQRLAKSLSFGVTTIEIKSGYGLDLATELKILNIVRELRREVPQEIVSTFMAAHSKPKEAVSTSEYVDEIIRSYLPKVRGLAEFQDVFCEEGYFSRDESIRLLNLGLEFGLRPKVHAHEFGRTGGVEVAVATGAISAEHLMTLNESDIAALKKANVIAVILPGTSVFLGAKVFAPARKLWDSGVRVAIATDFNPGTNPSLNLPLCGTYAALFQGLNLEEVLTAQTLHAALALARQDRGSLEVGKRADFVALEAESFEEMYYAYGSSLVSSVFIRGKRKKIL